MKRLILLLALIPACAAAEPPTEAEKKSALLRAYHLNGGSMIGWGSIDLPPLPVIAPPVEKWTGRNAIDAAADPVASPGLPPRHIAADLCARHQMHKVASPDGSSWKCRK